jgi:transposase-like protein
MKSLTKTSKPKLVSKDVQIQLSLPVAGVLRDVQSAFYGLCVNAGKAVLSAMMEEDRAALCGPKGVPDVSRTAYRGGHTRSWVTLGGRKIPVSRPRVRALGAAEPPLPTFAWAAHADPLNTATLAAIGAGVSMRRYRSTLDQLPAGHQEECSVSRSAVSRRFVALSTERLSEWLGCRLDKLLLPVIMIDGIYFRDHLVLIALGIDDAGDKHILGIREGSTENTRMVRSLLADLIERGLDATVARLWVIDGAKALRRAIGEVFGSLALVQRCQEHKRRNVLDHLPKELHASVSLALRDSWQSKDATLAKRQLERLARSLASNHPGACASLLEGLEETLTLTGLGIDGALYKTLRSTNPIENLNGLLAHYTRNVKRWKNGQMVLRWVGSALHEAATGFRCVRGFRDMKHLRNALVRTVKLDSTVQLKVA